jgi:hypothetical protein
LGTGNLILFIDGKPRQRSVECLDSGRAWPAGRCWCRALAWDRKRTEKLLLKRDDREVTVPE